MPTQSDPENLQRVRNLERGMASRFHLQKARGMVSRFHSQMKPVMKRGAPTCGFCGFDAGFGNLGQKPHLQKFTYLGVK